jgi:hypothetical protein
MYSAGCSVRPAGQDRAALEGALQGHLVVLHVTPSTPDAALRVQGVERQSEQISKSGSIHG